MATTAARPNTFVILDNGEIDDSALREKQANTWYSALIGRGQVLPNNKRQFTNADIAYQGPLFKRGTYFRSWKERFFILRRDIHQVCYYDNRESLVLLGSIQLKKTSQLSQVRPDEANGYTHAFCIIDVNESAVEKMLLMSARTADEMKDWMKYIAAEIMLLVKDEHAIAMGSTKGGNTLSWWDQLFIEAPILDFQMDDIRVRKVFATVNSRGVSGTGPISKASINILPKDIQNDNQKDSQSINLYALREEEDAEESDDEDLPFAGLMELNVKAEAGNSLMKSTEDMMQRRYKRMSTQKFRRIKKEKKERPFGPLPPECVLTKRLFSNSDSFQGLQVNLKLRNICQEDDQYYVIIYRYDPIAATASFVEQQTAQRQPGLRSINRSMSKTSAAKQEEARELSYSGWVQVSKSEGYTVTDAPEFNRITITAVHISFQVMLEPFSDSEEVYLLTFHRIVEQDEAGNTSLCMGRGLIVSTAVKTTPIFQVPLSLSIATLNLSDREEIDGKREGYMGVIQLSSKSLMRARQVFRSYMPYDPYVETIFNFNASTSQCVSLEQIFASKYAVTVARELSSLFLFERQPHVQSLLLLLEGEEENMNRIIETSLSQRKSNIRSSVVNDAVEDTLKDLARLDAIARCLAAVDFVNANMIGILRMVRNHCRDLIHDNQVGVNAVIPSSQGGYRLRRSVWKEPDRWQFITMNLNVHLFTTHCIPLENIESGSEVQKAPSELDVFPTITLGCSCAHRLKFKDGGLRSIFSSFTSDTTKLMWLQALQSSHSSDILVNLFTRYPIERASLFPFDDSDFVFAEEFSAQILRRKFELAHRIDSCTSQILGYAITTVRTICNLAAQGHQQYIDILGRSLKVGFLIACESFLSSFGDELGMIEDMEVAIHWLSLVSLRLVYINPGTIKISTPKETTPKETAPKEAIEKTNDEGPSIVVPPPGSDVSSTSNSARLQRMIAGSSETANLNARADLKDSDGVTVRRDVKTGRLIVDLEVSQREADIIQKCMSELNTYKHEGSSSLNSMKSPSSAPSMSTVTVNGVEVLVNSLRDVFTNHHEGKTKMSEEEFYNIFQAPIIFHENPVVDYVADERVPDVLAVAELYGVIFNQGVNAWQTLANMSSTSVQDQVEINKNSIIRLRDYCSRYRSLVMYQLIRREAQSANVHGQQGHISQGHNHNGTNGGNINLASPRENYNDGTMPSIFSTFHRVLGGNKQQMPSSSSKADRLVAALDIMLQEAVEAVDVSIAHPTDKHVHVLLKPMALCREMAGIVGILCKSGKDRTAMGVTLDIAAHLVNEMGAMNGKQICTTLRQYGCRRVNVYANTGQSFFAFGQFDRLALPSCFNPPAAACSGNVKG